ncbi:flippase [Methanosarcina mazei]|uniref:Uncharacterized protein n=1 Tax=Methanosarcina mazei TaxID=2209 RepID=A0A0F8GS83_METMZ|nr:flippase [Methanosarcina mazei]KKG56894.1 hypothetical protein DU64_05270 [Methanosarcina mazei]KKG57594.1 hypothetical protein DU33_19525 [Methanosarcina mazei]KKG63399.1 hypothetical protein DU45_20270 [Methanosarcina mazei]
MSTINNITKNAFFLLLAQIINLSLGFIYFIYMARYLGSAEFGIISFSIAFCGIFGIFIDFGLSKLMTREISRNKYLAPKYLGNILIIMLLIGITNLLLIIFIINILDYSWNKALTVCVMYLAMFSGTYTNIFNSMFQSFQRMEYQAIGGILNSIFMFVGVFIAIYNKCTTVEFAGIYVIANIIQLSFSVFMCNSRFIVPKVEIDFNFWAKVVKEAFPFGLSFVFITIYYWVDSVMLSFLQNDEAVGLYNVPYRLIKVLLIIPAVSNIILFPLMSQYYVTSKEYLNQIVQKYFRFMGAIGIPIGVGTTLLADKIILTIFGNQYIDSIISLKILVWSSVFIFLSDPLARLLESSNKQSIVARITFICMVENIILNLIAIPKYSYVGASATTLITELTALLLFIWYTHNLNIGLSKKSFFDLVKVILSSLTMSTIIVTFNNLNLYCLVTMSIICYFLTVYILKFFDESDRSIFNSIWQQISKALRI